MNVQVRAVAVIPAFNEAGTSPRSSPASAASSIASWWSTTGRRMGRRSVRASRGRRSLEHGAQPRQGTRDPRRARARSRRDFTHVLLLDGDLQHLPAEAPRLLEAAARTGRGPRARRARSSAARRCRRRAITRIGSAAASLSVVRRASGPGHAVWLPRLAGSRRSTASRCAARGYEIETEMLVKLRGAARALPRVPVTAVYTGQRSKLRPVRDTTKTCFSRSTTDSSNDSDSCSQQPPIAPGRDADDGRGPAAAAPRRWTLHGLNNGIIFRATYHGVAPCRARSRTPSATSAPGSPGGLMTRTRRGVADNLARGVPGRVAGPRSSGARSTRCAATRATSIDFLRALGRADRRRGTRCSSSPPEYLAACSQRLRAAARGIILVTGHYGNWEIGSMLMRRLLRLPLTIVAMAEAEPEVNRDPPRDSRLDRASNDRGPPVARHARSRSAAAWRTTGSSPCWSIATTAATASRVTLFGRPAWFLRTPVLMAHVTGAPLVPCFIERIGAERFRAFRENPCSSPAISRATTR